MKGWVEIEVEGNSQRMDVASVGNDRRWGRKLLEKSLCDFRENIASEKKFCWGRKGSSFTSYIGQIDGRSSLLHWSLFSYSTISRWQVSSSHCRLWDVATASISAYSNKKLVRRKQKYVFEVQQLPIFASPLPVGSCSPVFFSTPCKNHREILPCSSMSLTWHRDESDSLRQLWHPSQESSPSGRSEFCTRSGLLVLSALDPWPRIQSCMTSSPSSWEFVQHLLCDEHVEIVLVNQLLRRNMIGPNAQELLVCLRLHLVFHEPHQSCFRFVLRILGHPWLVTRDKCWTAQRLPYLQWDVSFCLKIEIQYWRTRTKTLVPSSVPTLKIDVDFIAAIGILYSQWNEGTTVILQLLQRRRWRCVNFRHLSGNNQRPRKDPPWAILYEKGSRRIVIVYRRSNTKVCLFLDNLGSREEIDNQRDHKQRTKQKRRSSYITEVSFTSFAAWLPRTM